jgi:nitroreductase
LSFVPYQLVKASIEPTEICGGAMSDVPLAEGPAGPEPPSAEDVARYVVAMAVLAPSVHNTRPWRFGIKGQEICLFADRDRQLELADPDGRELLISCGAALFTARLALRSLGYIPQAAVLPDPGQPTLVARVIWRQRARAAEYEQRLVSQVRRQRTYSGGFDPTPLSPDLLAALRQGAARDGTTLSIMPEDGRRILAAAVRTAERLFWLDGGPAQEPGCWEPAAPSRDFAAGTVGLLTTAADRPADWINAGHALQRILLIASTCAVAADLHGQPLELRSLREDIRTKLSGGAYPQLILRLRAISQVAAGVRRAPDDVMI